MIIDSAEKRHSHRAMAQSHSLSFSALIVGTCLLASSSAQAQPAFSKSFSIATIGPGSATALTYTFENDAAATPASAMTFTEVLPVGLTLATPSAARSRCASCDRRPPSPTAAMGPLPIRC